jgi:hypothetical protein
MTYGFEYAPFNEVYNHLIDNDLDENTVLPGYGVLSVIQVDEDVFDKASTKVCKSALEKWSGVSDWKRLWKKTVYQSNTDFDWVEVRVFFSQEKSQTVTVTIDRFGKAVVYDYDVRDFMEEIDQIVALAKKHYVGCDYCSILYNPIDKVVWFPMGDGGSISVDDIGDAMTYEDFGELDYESEIQPKHCPETNLDFVTESVYSDEFEPPVTMGFLPIGCYNEF